MLQPCPLCKQNLEFTPDLAGMVVECPFCKGQINCNFPAATVKPPPIPAQPYYPPQQQVVVGGRTRRRKTEAHPGIAALLSFFFPGAGQLYAGNVLGGLGMFIIWVVFLVLAVPTLGVTLIAACFVWIAGIFLAYVEASHTQRD